jgi:hypothetical protein
MTLLERLWPVLAVVCLLARPALAGKVEDLSRMLLDDSSYKVRLQAALLLGKVGDRAAGPALIKALGDDNRLVRGMAAQALGRVGAGEGAGPLKGLLEHERDGFVRREAEKALASLGPGTDGARGKAKIFLTFGSFGGGTRLADPTLLDALRAALQRELAKLSAITFAMDRGEEKSFGKSGRLGFLIDGTVSRLDDGVVGGAVEINCDVKVMVARWPSKSIILWTSAGAAVQGGSRERDKQSARRDCLEASAGQLGEDLAKFFQSQGG